MTHPKPKPRFTPEQRIAILEDKVAMLEDALGLNYEAPVVWGLTRPESQILGLLRRAPVVSRDRIMTALYASTDDPPHAKIIDQYIYRIRRKGAPHGLRIGAMTGVGYFLTREGRVALQSAEKALVGEVS